MLVEADATHALS